MTLNKCRDHWILIEIKITEQKINVWDSMKKDLALYQDIIDMIQREVYIML